MPPKTTFPSNWRNFEKFWFFEKLAITVEKVLTSVKFGQCTDPFGHFLKVILYKPLYKVSSQQDVYFKSLGVGYFCSAS